MLLLVGEEVSPRRRNHYLAFGLDEEIDHSRLDAAGDLSRGARRRRVRVRRPPVLARLGALQARRARHALRRARLRRLDGIELWSFVTDTGEAVRERPARCCASWSRPGRVLDHPPAAQHARLGRALPRSAGWWRSAGSTRTSSASAIGPVVPLRIMGYHRSFRYIRTHVLCDGRRTRRARARPRAGLRGAARRALLHRGRLGRARRAAFASRPTTCRWAPRRPPARRRLSARTPLDAKLRLLRDGARDRRRRRPRARGGGRGSRASTASRRCAAPRGASAPGSCRTRSTCGTGPRSRRAWCGRRRTMSASESSGRSKRALTA